MWSWPKKQRQKGAMIVMTAASLVFLFGMAGLAIDGGNIYMHKGNLDNNAAAAAWAAGNDYAKNQSESSAKRIAREYVEQNKSLDKNVTIDTIEVEDDPNDKDAKLIRVNLKEEVPVYFMRLFGQEKTNIKNKGVVRVKKTSQGSWPFDFAICGGDTAYTQNSKNGNAITFDNNVVIKGAVHANGGIFMDADGMVQVNGSLSTYGNQDMVGYGESGRNLTWATAYGVNDQSWSWSHFTDAFQKGNDNPLHMDLNEAKMDYNTWYNNYVKLPNSITNGYVYPERQHDDEVKTPTPTKYGSPDPGHYIHYSRIQAINSDGNLIENSYGNTDLMPTENKYVHTEIEHSDNRALYEYIQGIAKMSEKERQANQKAAIFYDSGLFEKGTGDYKGGNNATAHYFNPSSAGSSYYPCVTNSAVTVENGNPWDIWNFNYKVFIVDGDLTLNIPQNLNPSSSDYFVAISLHGNISLQNGSAVHALLYAPEGRILLDGRQDLPILGSFVGKQVYITSQNKNIDGSMETATFDFNKETKWTVEFIEED